LVGNFANKGVEWMPAGAPERMNVHDFADKDLGEAPPYGIYDVTANIGWVNVGADTGAFAVESIRRWWHTLGQSLGGDRVVPVAVNWWRRRCSASKDFMSLSVILSPWGRSRCPRRPGPSDRSWS